MSYHSGDVERLLIEIETGKTPAIPDTPELAALRVKLAAECAEIRARGMGVEIPQELP
jgi:hypothetical protein